MNEVIKLIQKSVTTNEYGEKLETEKAREVLGTIKSVSQKEFYEGMANGLNLELRFEIADYMDYDGENEAEISTRRYNIVRAYRTVTNSLELTLSRGLNNDT